jgi:DNA phosphorothioation-associated putative methyltransferase
MNSLPSSTLNLPEEQPPISSGEPLSHRPTYWRETHHWKSRRDKTAIHRGDRLSAPLQIALKEGYLSPQQSLLDYGCGRGDDINNLRKLGYRAAGFDPKFCPSALESADVVSLIYVLNVIEQDAERPLIVEDAYSMAKQGVLLAIRVPDKTHMGEGFTCSGTYQKYFTPDEIEGLIASICPSFHKLKHGIYYLPKLDDARILGSGVTKLTSIRGCRKPIHYQPRLIQMAA